MTTPLLAIEDLKVQFQRVTFASLLTPNDRPSVRAVNGVSLAIRRGETVGLVGESGCGKTTLGRAVLRLVEPTSGKVMFDGADVLRSGPRELFALRRRMQMVFQDPYGSLNPRLTVAETLSEVHRVHGLCPRNGIAARVRTLMHRVGLSPELADRRPAALSGGQCQRVGIARALVVGPELVIADEPVSALDISIQAQILNLFATLQQEMQLSLLFISHDLGVVRHLCRTVAVMYLGRIVEIGPTEEIFAVPRHPYTKALLEAMPSIRSGARLPARGLPGEPPSASRVPRGCAFHPRCPAVMDACRTDPSPAERTAGPSRVWCHLYPIASNES